MKLVKDDREPELYRPTRLRGDLLRRPGDARELSRSPEQARAIAELVAFTRKRLGCTPSPIERQLFEDAAARGPKYFNAFLERVIGNRGSTAGSDPRHFAGQAAVRGAPTDRAPPR